MRSYDTGHLDLGPVDIFNAQKTIAPYVRQTPLEYASTLSERIGCEIYLKMECWQVCGCFKVRGAVNMVASLSAEQRKRGVVAASSGNHGIALAYASRLFENTGSIIYAPLNADTTKMKKIQALGGEVRLHGEHYLLALDETLRQVEESDLTLVHSHSHPLIMAGQGTIGLEIMDDLPDADAIIVPIGGGGLISGILTAVHSISDTVRIIGVESDCAPGAYMSFRDGICHEQIELKPSIADGISGGLAPLAWKILKDRLHQVEIVSDGEIIEAMKIIQNDEQLMIEGAAAVGLAAILNNKLDLRKKEKIVVVLTSRNMNAARYNEIIYKHIGVT